MEYSFVSADIGKIADFEKRSAAAIKEFDSIKQGFVDANTELMTKWKGDGAEIYKTKTDHILDNVGTIKEILDSINEGVVKDIKDAYLQLDKELGDYSRSLVEQTDAGQTVE